MARTQGVGVLSRELAVNAGVTGSDAARQRRELRHPQSDNYGIYERFFSACRWASMEMFMIDT